MAGVMSPSRSHGMSGHNGPQRGDGHLMITLRALQQVRRQITPGSRRSPPLEPFSIVTSEGETAAMPIEANPTQTGPMPTGACIGSVHMPIHEIPPQGRTEQREPTAVSSAESMVVDSFDDSSARHRREDCPSPEERDPNLEPGPHLGLVPVPHGGGVSSVLVRDSPPLPPPPCPPGQLSCQRVNSYWPYIWWCRRRPKIFFHSPCLFCPLCTPTLSLNPTLTLMPTPTLSLLLTLPPNLSLDPDPNQD